LVVISFDTFHFAQTSFLSMHLGGQTSKVALNHAKQAIVDGAALARLLRIRLRRKMCQMFLSAIP